MFEVDTKRFEQTIYMIKDFMMVVKLKPIFRIDVCVLSPNLGVAFVTFCLEVVDLLGFPTLTPDPAAAWSGRVQHLAQTGLGTPPRRGW